MNVQQVVSESLCNINQDGESKYHRQLMDKDKIIYDYTKILKETERNLENTKKQLVAKDEIITNIKDENKELKYKVKNLENHLERKEDEMRKFRNVSEEKILLLSKEKVFGEDKINDTIKTLEQHQQEYQVN